MRTKAKVIILATLALTAATIGLQKSHSLTKSRVPLSQQDPSAMTGLEWRASQAQAGGQTEVNLIADRVMYTYVQGLDEAINNYTIVVAQPILQKGYPDSVSENVETWYKFSVSEYISRKPPTSCTGCSPPSNPPADLLPLNANEILVPRSGGDLVINGVTIISVDAQFPSFLHSQQYLLFLDLDPSTGVGAVKVGPIGAFAISGDQLVSLYGDSHPLKDELESRYGNSLSALRSALNPPPPPPPSGCDPIQQQNCIDNGGTWKSTDCTCQPAFDPCLKKPWLCE
jgi:hypothetical protein